MTLTPAAPGKPMATRTSITGDPILDAALPAAQQAIGAIHEFDVDAVHQAIADADTAVRTAIADQGRPAPLEGIELGARALVVILGGMVSEDRPPTTLLAWLQEPLEYQRLIEEGVSADQARVLCTITAGVAA